MHTLTPHVAVGTTADALPAGGASRMAPQRVLAWIALSALFVAAMAALVLRVPGSPAAVAMVTLAMVLLLAASPSATAVAIVALVPVTAGLPRGAAGIPGLRPSELLVIFGAFVVLFLWPANPVARWHRLDWAVLAYAAVGAALPLGDLLARGARPGLGDLQTIGGPVQFFLLYRTASVALRTQRRQVLAQRALLLASIPVSVLGVAEALGPPVIHDTLVSLTGTTAFSSPGYDPVLRAASVFPIWLSLAGYLLVPVLLSVSLLLNRSREVLPTWLLAVVAILGVMATVSSLTVTILAAMGLGCIYLGWRHGSLLRVLGLAAVATVAGWVAFGEQVAARVQAQQGSPAVNASVPAWVPQTLQYRVSIWQEQFVDLVQRYLATGYGPGYPPGVSWAHTESGYLTILLRGGLPYLVVTGVLLATVVSRARTEAANSGSRERTSLAEVAGLLALLQVVVNLTFPYFTASGLPQPMWLLWGLLAAPIVGNSPRPVGRGTDRTSIIAHRQETAVR